MAYGVDKWARILAEKASSDLSNISASDIQGLGTAATKNTGTSAGQVPITDSQGKLPIDVIPSSLTSPLYKGAWDASSGTFPSATIVGEFWIISTQGIISGQTYFVNDQIIWNGTTFDHIDNSQVITFAQDIKRCGFVDNTSTESPYLSGTAMDVVNLDDAGAGWSYYKNGQKYTITGNKTIVLTGGAGNAHADGVYWITISDGAGTLAVSQNAPDITTDVIVAYVYWNNEMPVGEQSIIADERHTILWDSLLHEEHHENVGATLHNDVAIFDYVLNSSVDSNKQFSLSATELDDEDLGRPIPEILGENGVYTNFYRTSEGVWGWEQDANFPFRYATNGRMIYDTTTGGTEATSGKYINTYVFASNFNCVDCIYSITGQTQYSTESEARREHFTDLDLSGLFLNELVVLHRITWKTDDLFTGTGKCQMIYTRPIMENAIGLRKIYKLRTNDITPSLDRRFVTDDELAVLQSTSGSNTGDETQETILNKLGYSPEPTISGSGNTTDFWSGEKTWRNLATDVRAIVLTGLSLLSGVDITESDSIVSAFGKIQKQISTNLTTLTNHIGNTLNPHNVTKTQVGLGNVVNSDTTTTVNITDSTDKRFVSDAQRTAITHSNRTNLDKINQDLSTTGTPTFAELTVGNVSNTELQYLDGVTSGIQAQIESREPNITILPINKGGTNSNTVLSNNRVMISSGDKIVESGAITASRALVSNLSGLPIASTVTATELGYLSGVTSVIQTQLEGKEPNITKGNLSETTSSVLTITGGTGAVIGSGATIQVKQANGSTNGYLTSTDWTTFNNKQSALGFTPEDVAHKNTSTLSTSTTTYPCDNTVKTYVDSLVAHPHGHLYEDTNLSPTTINMTVANTFYKWSNSVAGISSGVTLNTTNDNITINSGSDGVYAIQANVAGLFSRTNTNYTVAIYKNGSAIMKSYFRTSNANNMADVEIAGYQSLVATDVLDLRVSSTASGDTLQVYKIDLMIHRL